ncbi:hypothetical protein KAT92_04510, partial [Candidatus Babeliales bacterium]|nr:hypothetical protein [Candidatus Babeliales bacterium]
EIEKHTDKLFIEGTYGGKQIRSLKNFYLEENPLHKRGELSHTINLGDATMPAFECADLDDLLKNRKLYAWTTNCLIQPNNEADGDGRLEELLGNDDFYYQIFAFKTDSDAEEPSEKKHKARE